MLRFFRRRQEDRARTERAVRKTRRTWFGHVAELLGRGRLDEETWEELEELLISADVGVATTEALLDSLRERVRRDGLSDPSAVVEALKEEMVALLDRGDARDVMAVQERPLVVLMVGVNGVGKTTSIAKLAHLFQGEGLRVMLGAADTFRAAAIEQLQAWGQRLGVEVVAHRHGADPGAVAFDALQAARARGMDAVIIDTAGRLHTRHNLMEELKKVRRVLLRQGAEGSLRTVLTLDATVGQNGLVQARAFTEALECHGVFLAKLDGTAKGGVVLAIAQELGLPVLYIGTGEGPEDVALFDPRDFVEGLFAPEPDD